jgi:hypothetical protein
MLRLLAAFSLGLFSGAYLIRRERVPMALLEASWDDEEDGEEIEITADSTNQMWRWVHVDCGDCGHEWEAFEDLAHGFLACPRCSASLPLSIELIPGPVESN